MEFTLQKIHSNEERIKLFDLKLLIEGLNDITTEDDITKKVTELKDILESKRRRYNDKVAKRSKQLECTINKYWEVTTYDEKYSILHHTELLYGDKIIHLGQKYWAVRGIVDDPYKSGIESVYIEYTKEWQNKTVFKEITREEFIRRVNEHNEAVIRERLNTSDTVIEQTIF